MSLVTNLLSVIRKITTVIVIAIAFLFGVVTTVYLSLRSPEVQVPDIVGKDRFEAERILAKADLNFRVRATRPSRVNPDTVLFQLPRPGEIVKAGQTVAMDISRVAKEGEAPETVRPVEDSSTSRNDNSAVNSNDNKPRRPRNRNDNENGNTNSNVNANRAANANRNVNANRTSNANRTNSNSENANVPRSNANRSDVHNSNVRPNANVNENRRPILPKPSPAATNSNRQPR